MPRITLSRETPISPWHLTEPLILCETGALIVDRGTELEHRQSDVLPNGRFVVGDRDVMCDTCAKLVVQNDVQVRLLIGRLPRRLRSLLASWRARDNDDERPTPEKDVVPEAVE